MFADLVHWHQLCAQQQLWHSVWPGQIITTSGDETYSSRESDHGLWFAAMCTGTYSTAANSSPRSACPAFRARHCALRGQTDLGSMPAAAAAGNVCACGDDAFLVPCTGLSCPKQVRIPSRDPARHQTAGRLWMTRTQTGQAKTMGLACLANLLFLTTVTIQITNTAKIPYMHPR